MNVDSKRFRLRSDGFGNATVHDRDAPYHLHTVPARELPSVDALARMTESQFNSAVHRAIYGEKP